MHSVVSVILQCHIGHLRSIFVAIIYLIKFYIILPRKHVGTLIQACTD